MWIGSISAAILAVFLFGQYYEIQDEKQAAAFLNTNAELLVIILAVTMSFTLLGLQFLAESYTPRALVGFLKDKVIYGFPILYLVLISLNLISSAVPSIIPPIEFLQYAVIGTIFSLVYLVGFIYYIINKIQPERLIVDTAKSIQDDAWKHIVENKGSLEISSPVFKPFIILEQIMIKSVNKNDIFSFVQGLRILFSLLDRYLAEIHKEFQTHKNQAKQGWDSDYVYKFFFRILAQLVTESINHNREQFITQYQGHMFNEIIRIYEYRNHRAIEDFWDQLDYVGHKIFNLEMISVAEPYIRNLEQFMKIELGVVKRTKRTFSKDSLGYKRRSNDEVVDEILADNFRYDRINSLTEFGIIAANKKMDNLLSTIFAILREMIDDVLEINDGITRRTVLYSLTQCVKKIHEASVDNGLRNSTFTTHMLHYHIEKIDKRYMDDAKDLTERYCKLSLYSIEHEDYFEISQLGVNCRMLVENYQDLVIVILNALEKCFAIIKNEKDDELRENQTKELIKEIKSAEKWNKNKHIQVTSRVKEILDKNS